MGFCCCGTQRVLLQSWLGEGRAQEREAEGKQKRDKLQFAKAFVQRCRGKGAVCEAQHHGAVPGGRNGPAALLGWEDPTIPISLGWSLRFSLVAKPLCSPGGAHHPQTK